MSKLISILIAISIAGCASATEPAGDGGADVDLFGDAPLTTVVNTYVACVNSGGCTPDTACLQGVCTLPCEGFDARTCPIPPVGMQVACVESRCLLACDDARLTCPDATTCQRVGQYDVCVHP